MSTLSVNNVTEVGGAPVVTSGVLDSGSLPTGTVLQVVSNTYNTATTVTTSANYYDLADLNTNLTCSSASNKVLITATVSGYFPGDLVSFALTADGSVISDAVGASASNRVASSANNLATSSLKAPSATITFLHSPASTSAVTYGVRLLEATSGTQSDTWYINRSTTDSDNDDRVWSTCSITLMEVAG